MEHGKTKTQDRLASENQRQATVPGGQLDEASWEVDDTQEWIQEVRTMDDESETRPMLQGARLRKQIASQFV